MRTLTVSLSNREELATRWMNAVNYSYQRSIRHRGAYGFHKCHTETPKHIYRFVRTHDTLKLIGSIFPDSESLGNLDVHRYRSGISPRREGLINQLLRRIGKGLLPTDSPLWDASGACHRNIWRRHEAYRKVKYEKPWKYACKLCDHFHLREWSTFRKSVHEVGRT